MNSVRVGIFYDGNNCAIVVILIFSCFRWRPFFSSRQSFFYSLTDAFIIIIFHDELPENIQKINSLCAQFLYIMSDIFWWFINFLLIFMHFFPSKSHDKFHSFRHVHSVKWESHKFAIWEAMRRRERGEGWKLIKINTAHYNVFSSSQTHKAMFIDFFHNWIHEGEKWIIEKGWNNNKNSFNPRRKKIENCWLAPKSRTYLFEK